MSKHKGNHMFVDVANKLIKELNALGIKCYIWHTATTGSVYIRFEDNRMCSIRLGDHDGREKLKYKFNLRSDYSPKANRWVKDDKIWRYFLPLHMWKELIPVLQDRHKQVQTWEKSKYKYNIPSFKKDFEPTYNELKNG